MSDPAYTHPHQLATILDSIADGVFTVDPRLHITSFNRAAEEITGFTREEAIGQPCCEIFRTSVCFNHCPVREALRSGEPVRHREVEILDRHNREVPISISASALRDERGHTVGGVETFRDLSQLQALRQEVLDKTTFHDLISRNPRMRELFDVMPDVAASEATVLIQGESGSGKELVARAVHDLSGRAGGSLVVVNCGALPENLLEAEIFGVKKGAYTGAGEDRPGRLEQARGGSLLLDEVGDLPLPLQVKLLRVLESKEFQPLGGRTTVRADVRFIAATHRDLQQMIAAGTFRQDLYFRLHVVPLRIPPLRERPEDVPLLLEAALIRFNHRYGKRIQGFAPEAMARLLSHPYPGNVRELLNVVERAVILCRSSEIGADLLPEGLREGAGNTPAPCVHGQRPSRDRLLAVLAQHGNNHTSAARALGVHRTTLWRWLQKSRSRP